MLRELAIASRNLALGGNLKTLTMSPRRAVTYASECLFVERLMNQHGDLPQRSVSDFLSPESDISITLRPSAARNWLYDSASFQADLIALASLARVLRAKRIFEIGTMGGASALHLAMNAPEALVYTLDIPPKERPSLAVTAFDRIHQSVRPQRVFSGMPEAARIVELWGDSAVFDFSPFREKIDLFFIDGAHSYEYVKSDTLKAIECCHPGSVIAWHDYGRCGINGVSRWLHEFRDSGHSIFRNPGGSLAYMRS